MSDNYREIWRQLEIDLEKHDQFLAPLPEMYGQLFLAQHNRPQGMAYFDDLMGEIHGRRVQELVEFKQQGGIVAGTFCVFVPDELILAAGGASVGLCVGAQFPIAAAEEVLPRNTCPLVKAALGFRLQAICPYSQVSDLIIGETTCDGKKKLWELMDELIPTYVMELPQRKEEASRELWKSEIRRLCRRLEQQSGKKVTAESLAAGIKITNNKRRALQRLYNCRRETPVPISGKDALLITQLAFFDDPVRFTDRLNNLCDELEAKIKNTRGKAEKGPRILVTGTPMPLPYWKLHHLVESAGGVVVCEESCTGTRYFEAMVPETGESLEDQLAAVAFRAMQINCACYTPNTGRVEDVLRQLHDYRVQGVIYYNLQFCQLYSSERYQMEKALRQSGVPMLHLESDFSQEDIPQLDTRIQAFFEILS